MTQQTPKKSVDVLQVPSSSPIDQQSRAEAAAKNREATRKRFHDHIHWPVLRKRFYYLEEPEIFKGMVKGKGNLRDISLWLAENINLNDRLHQYDLKQEELRVQQQKQQLKEKQDVQNAQYAPQYAPQQQKPLENVSNNVNNANIETEKPMTPSNDPISKPPSKWFGDWKPLPESLYQTPNGSEPSPIPIASPKVARTDLASENASITSTYDDEDASPIKKAGKARQKRPLPTVDSKPPAPDTKVHLLKPKVSILEKYRNRQQSKIDYLFQRAPAPAPAPEVKKRKLVRASDLSSSLPVSKTASPAPSTSSHGSMGSTIKPGVLTASFGYTGDEIPRLKSISNTPIEVDELEILEEKIKNNRKKKSAFPIDSDGELEEEVFSDDMSEEDDFDKNHAGLTSIDDQILEFLNQAPAEDIIEICNAPPKAAEMLIEKRPFNTIYEIAEDKLEGATPEPEGKRKYQRKALGLKIVESAEYSLKGYKAVDSLVKKCSDYGNLILRQMARWGVKVTGEGELSVVDIDVKDEDQPEVTKDVNKPEIIEILENAEDDDDDDDVGGGLSSRRSIPYVKHKPTLLAPEVELKSYQQVGLNWLHLLYHHKLSCILADEMGLGKTCQVITFMAHLKAVSEESGPHLVVVPASTLENWLREFQKFCPSLEVQAYYGSQSEREDLRYELAESTFDVLVTTYNLATGSAPDFKFLKSRNFDMIVYDEGHMLKNSNSERYNKLMRLKAGFRLLLTGTPLQNNLKELVSLLAFMLPGLFVEKRDDLQGLFNKKASVDGTGDYNPLLSQQAINKAKTMMTPFVLRRKKAQVLKYLPGKSHEIVRCDMTPKQREIYDKYIRQGKETRLERERRKALKGKEADLNRFKPIASSSNVMMALRKACMHPLLFRTIYTDDKLKEMSKKIMKEPEYVSANLGYILEDMQVMSDFELNALCEKFPKSLREYVLPQDEWLNSGKTQKLLEVVKSVIEKKEKVLVFSLFTQMLDILERVLSFANITFVRLDGQTSVDTRQDIIDRFYEDETIPVFLLSTKAGGFGINLVAANNVVIFDQSFNPHDDKQAEDRAHRVGQSSEVYVTKLISDNTIDENILMLAENKLQLDHSISTEADSKFEEKAVSMFESILFK